MGIIPFLPLQKSDKCVLINFALTRFYSATVGLAEVTSANVVGYETDSLKGSAAGGIMMRGIMFNNVAGGDYDLNALNIANIKGGLDTSDSDTIKVWDGVGYTTYFYCDYEGAEESGDKGWWDFGGVEASVLPLGTAFWYQSAAEGGTNKPKNITVSGEVESADDVPVDIVDGKINMMINPYPVMTELNNTDSVSFENITGGLDTSDSDVIKMWDGVGYVTFFYCDYEGAEETGDKGWWDFGGVEESKIASGNAFWYVACIPNGQSAKTGEKVKKITFKSPIKK